MDTNSHSHYFLYQGYQVLLESSGLFQPTPTHHWRHVYRVSDNGRPFMTRFSCFIESYFQDKLGITIEVLPLCEYHGWSLADSHAGVVKSNMRKAEIANQSPPSLREMQELLEVEIGNTQCFPQVRIHVSLIDRDFYGKFVGVNAIGPVEGISEVGHITYAGVGLVKTRIRATSPDVIDFPFVLPLDVVGPDWAWHDLRLWEEDNICRSCSKLHCKPVEKHHCALTPRYQTPEGRRMRSRQSLPPPAPPTPPPETTVESGSSSSTTTVPAPERSRRLTPSPSPSRRPRVERVLVQDTEWAKSYEQRWTESAHGVSTK